MYLMHKDEKKLIMHILNTTKIKLVRDNIALLLKNTKILGCK